MEALTRKLATLIGRSFLGNLSLAYAGVRG